MRASGVHIWGYLEGPCGWYFHIRSKKSFKKRPNSPYGGETSSYSLLQQGVGSKYSQMENPEDSTSYIELLMYNLRTRMVARITSLDMDNKNHALHQYSVIIVKEFLKV